MGKKAHRRRRAAGPRLSAAQLIRPEEQAATDAPALKAKAVATSPTPKATPRALRDLKEEYPYVVADLKQIAIIGTLMLVLMLGLALLLV